MNERARRFAQICKYVRERAGDRRTDADPEQQGDDAEKHSDEDVGWGPHVSESIPNLRLCLARPAIGRQAAQQRRGARRIAVNIARLPELLSRHQTWGVR